jgi:hypothetical protein
MLPSDVCNSSRRSSIWGVRMIGVVLLFPCHAW